MSLSIAGIILAGGLSRRMGGENKATLTLGNQTLLDHVATRLQKQVNPIAINANHKDIEDKDLPILKDSLKGFLGPLAGVLTGLQWAEKNQHSHIITVATDTPFFPENLLNQFLTDNDNKSDRIVLAGSDGYRHPVFGLWPVSIADDLNHWLQNTDTNKVLAFVHRHDWAIAEFELLKWGDQILDPFFNINTPEDLAHAETLLSNKS